MQHLTYLTNKVNNKAIRSIKNDRGDLVYVIPSFTMVFDSVLNGGLYPAAEITKSYHLLDGTPAPCGHPVNSKGEYVSASSEDGVLYYQCGIFNKNAQLVIDDKWGGRVYSEMHIHVETAMLSERGRRVIEAIEAGEPIHTSTGVLCIPVEQEGVNAQGVPYTWVATEISIDHNAVLLDEDGAATPADGVGLLVNQNLFKTVQRDGLQMTVNTVSVNQHQPEPLTMLDQMRQLLTEFFHNNRAPAQTNQEGEDMSFKAHIEKTLEDAKVDFSNMTDEEKINAYDKAIKGSAADEKANEDGKAEPKGELAANAALTKLIADQIAAALKANKQTEEAEQRKALAEKLGLDATEAASMSVNSLQKLLEKTTSNAPAYGLAGGQMNVNSASALTLDELPE